MDHLQKLASVWTRVWCNALDVAMVVVVWAAIAAPIAWEMGLFTAPQRPGGGEEDPLFMLVAFLLLAFWSVAYFAVSYHKWGRTPAMRLGRIIVVNEGDITAPVSWRSAIVRSVLLMVGYLCAALPVIWLVLTLVSPKRQGPHDLAAHTLVVRGR